VVTDLLESCRNNRAKISEAFETNTSSQYDVNFVQRCLVDDVETVLCIAEFYNVMYR
jgi:hypothetical protein